MLGRLLLYGEGGVPQNAREAAAWFDKAAAAGLAAAQYELARLYDFGTGIPGDAA